MRSKPPSTRHRGISPEIRQQWNETYSRTPYHRLPWFSPTPYPWVVDVARAGWWRRGARILDLGCGAGTNSLFLAKLGFRVTGVDLAERAIEAARERAARAKLKVDFQVADVLDLPFREAEFGGAIDIGCFHTLPFDKRARYASELSRVLHPRRFLAISWVAREFKGEQGPPHRPSMEEVATALEEEFLFYRTEYRPSASGRQIRGAPAVYCALLGRRSFPRPAVR